MDKIHLTELTGEPGFSLVETMIVLAIGAFVVGGPMLYSMTHVWKDSSRIQSAGDTIENLVVPFDKLRDDIKLAKTVNATITGGPSPKISLELMEFDENLNKLRSRFVEYEVSDSLCYINPSLGACDAACKGNQNRIQCKTLTRTMSLDEQSSTAANKSTLKFEGIIDLGWCIQNPPAPNPLPQECIDVLPAEVVEGKRMVIYGAFLSLVSGEIERIRLVNDLENRSGTEGVDNGQVILRRELNVKRFFGRGP